MGLLQMILLVFFGMYVLNVNWGDDPLLLLGFLTCFSLAGTSLGLMIGAFTKSVKQADNMTTLVSMAMAALGGAWWPLEITPASYQTIVRGLPSTWAMLGFNDIIIKGQGLSGALLESAVLLGFSILFAMIGIWKLNKME
jgi:ABC-2 type transport system permease protein